MSTTLRLAKYSLIAAAVPAAGAHAGIVAQTNLGVIVNPGESAFINLTGFGEVFRFELRTNYDYLSDRSASFYNALFQFNPANGNVDSAGFVAGSNSIGTARSVYNDPARLDFGAPISIERAFYAPMTDAFSTSHDLAFKRGAGVPALRYGSEQYSFSNWNPSARGYIGFTLFTGGSQHFGWLDVETVGFDGFSPERNVDHPYVIIHGWGFQDEPRIGINAGQIPAPAVGGLAALAFGAAGIRRSRRIEN